MVGRTSVWSENTLSSRPRRPTPGPASPSRWRVMSCWKSPWFQATWNRRDRASSDRAGRSRGAVAAAGGEEEVVVVAEHGERRRARRALGHHVQALHLRLVGEPERQLVDGAGDRVGGDQGIEVLLHLTGHRVGRRGLAGDVDRRRVVAVHRERRGVAALAWPAGD